MRIVGGALSGRRFGKPVGDTRPTSERVREALGSALEARGLVRDSAVLDLFAGTGALGFELLSRGATRAVLVDHEARARRGIGQSAAALGLEDRTVVMSVDLLGPPARVVARLHEHGPFDLVIADPPWAEAGRVPSLLLALANAGVTAADARMVLEHASRAPPELPDGLATEASYRYGDTAVVVVRALPRPDEGTTPPCASPSIPVRSTPSRTATSASSRADSSRSIGSSSPSCPTPRKRRCSPSRSGST